ncbi:MAG: class I SAM-dependent methyltransferase [Actinomycetota bacterium]
MDQRKMISEVFDRSAPTYDSVGVEFFSIFGHTLVDDASLKPGEHVLDIGCGRGAVLFPAAEQVSPGGTVTGIDLAPTMIELVKSDAHARGVGNIQAFVMDAQEPKLEPESFDVALCSLVLFFLPAPAAALAQWRETIKPGGRLGLTTFAGDDDRWSWLDPLFDPYKPEPMRRAAQSKEEGPFSSTVSLERLLQDSGFVDPHSVVRNHEIRFVNADQWVAFSWSHGQRAFWEFVPQERRQEVEQQARVHLSKIAERDGSIMLHQPVRYSFAHR